MKFQPTHVLFFVQHNSLKNRPSSNVTDSMRVGDDATSTGNLTVTGTGSTLSVGDDLSVGDFSDGTATASIGAGGTVSVGDTTGIGSEGTLNLNGGTLTTQVFTKSIGGRFMLGDSASPIGFSSDGVVNVGGNTVTLNDSKLANLGMLTTLTSGGTLDVANDAVIDFTDNITGEGTVQSPNDATKPIINNGAIVGDSLANPITLAGYVKGVGTCDNCNITGTDAPGFSPATVNRGSVSYNGTLEIEIGGTSSGDFDQLNHILGAGIADLGGMLDVELINGFTPTAGDMFEIPRLTQSG